MSLILNLLLYFVALNLLPDYVSLLETRYIIKLMGKSGSFTWHITLLVFDGFITLLIAATLPLLLALFSISMVASEPISLQRYLTALLPLTGHSLLLRGDSGFPMVGAPFLAICFYTSFLTSVWIWFYALAGFLWKALALWEFTKDKVNLDEKPLTYIGAMAITVLTVAYLWISVLPVRGGDPVAGRNWFDDLRSVGTELSQEDAANMIRSRGYYDIFYNIRGRGIENVFELLPGDSIIHDAITQLYWQRSGLPSRWILRERWFILTA